MRSLPMALIYSAALLASPVDGQVPAAADSTRPALFMSRNRPVEYPEVLRQAYQEGEVVLELEVDTTGRPRPQSIVIKDSPHDLFSQPVLAAVAQWRWAPALRSGTAVSERKRYTFQFVILRREAPTCPPSYVEHQVICGPEPEPQTRDGDWPAIAPAPAPRRPWWHVFWPF